MSLSDNVEGLPAELMAEILSYLDVPDLIRISTTSRTLRIVLSDPILNPWRVPLLRLLDYQTSPLALTNISVRYRIFPKANWIIILSRSDPRFLLYECVIPHLSEQNWEAAFEARYLPSWKKWKKEGMKWREAFLRVLAMVSHRLESHCKVNQTWTKYVVLNRNGSANELDASSRDLDVFRTFNQLKHQANLTRLETSTRVILQMPDVKIVALGVRESPRSAFSVNANAYHFCHPPKGEDQSGSRCHAEHLALSCYTYRRKSIYVTEGNTEVAPADWRHGPVWVGPLMLVWIVAELAFPNRETEEDVLDLNMPGSQRYVSFSWKDLWTIAPWMREHISRCIDGPGLGVD